MSKIDNLIKQLCPKGVECKKIGDICEISRGIVISKNYIQDNIGEYPVYSSQTEDNGCLGKIKTFAFEGEYLTWTTDGANAGTLFYRTGRFNITNVCGLLKVKDNAIYIKYLYYSLGIEAPKYVNNGAGKLSILIVMLKVSKRFIYSRSPSPCTRRDCAYPRQDGRATADD
jgi:type I restriction enzyme S subunit